MLTVVEHRQPQEDTAGSCAYSRSHGRPCYKHTATVSAVPRNIIKPFPIPYEPK